MKKQGGFTLVEIAIVLVIIGLLLGGVLKGQELINSAKVKNFANDFRNIPLFIYGYQDKFRALPGDDPYPADHLGTGATKATNDKQGNGVIEGAWNSNKPGDESILFWQHVRLAGLASGPTTAPTSATEIQAFLPKNADSGIIGIASGIQSPVDGLSGTHIVCSAGILGKFAKQLDTTMDDGATDTGSMRTIATPEPNQTTAVKAIAGTSVQDANSYTVCMSL